MTDSIPMIESRAKEITRGLPSDDHNRWMWLGEQIGMLRATTEQSTMQLEAHIRRDEAQFSHLSAQMNQVNIAINADALKDGERRGAEIAWNRIRKWGAWIVATAIAVYAAWKSK
jgi:hypothetical protein